MSVFASGALAAGSNRVGDKEPYVKSILFGASSRANIENTVALIREADGQQGAGQAD